MWFKFDQYFIVRNTEPLHIQIYTASICKEDHHHHYYHLNTEFLLQVMHLYMLFLTHVHDSYCHCFHFADEELKTQEGEITFSVAHAIWKTELNVAQFSGTQLMLSNTKNWTLEPS